MKYEKSRIEAEKRANEEKAKQRLEYERRLQEKNQREKEKKKAKNVRRSARKAQIRADQENDSEDIEQEDEEITAKVTKADQTHSKRSFFGAVLVSIWLLIRVFLFVSIISLSIFIGLSIGLHLQSGHKLESLADVRTALSDSLTRLENYEQFSKDLVSLIESIAKSVKNLWKTNLHSSAKQENQTNA